jgi:SSS family solute:Na+ symporter
MSYCWPHMFASAFSAGDGGRSMQRRIMPLCQIPILLVFFVGFTALLVLPGLKQPDTALLTLVTRSYPGWFAGFVGGAGAVTAMVPASMLLLVASTLVAKNLYRPLRRGECPTIALMRARAFMPRHLPAVALRWRCWSLTSWSSC